MTWQIREMSPGQLRRVIKQLRLSQAATGRFLGVGDRQTRRYLTGEAAIPVAHALLLRAMIHYGEGPVVPNLKQSAEERARR